MPNHITNLISFGSDSASRSVFQRMLHDMKAEGQPLGSFDFNKLLPMPKELDMEAGARTDRGLKLVQEYHHALAYLEQQKPALTPEDHAARLRLCKGLYRKRRMADPETWALGEQAYNNIQSFGSPTWHEWCSQNWGTKWNAYGSLPLEKDPDTMGFYTAWDPVPNIVVLLSKKYPEQTITYRWADEDIGHNVGEKVFRNGECVEETIPEGGSRIAYEMAAEIIGADLTDFNLYLNKDKTSYEYQDGPPAVQKPQPIKKPKQKGRDR